MRIEGDVRRLGSDSEPRAGTYVTPGVVGDPIARGRAHFESIAVRCGSRGLISAGECLRCESFAGLEHAGDDAVVVYCRPRCAEVGSLMTPVSSIAAVSPYTRVSDAVGYAEYLGIDQLLVATDDAVVGTVCRCQLVDRSDLELVAERMCTELPEIDVNASHAEAIAILETSESSLCVVAGDVLVGLVSRRALRASREPAKCDTCGSCPIDLQ